MLIAHNYDILGQNKKESDKMRHEKKKNKSYKNIKKEEELPKALQKNRKVESREKNKKSKYSQKSNIRKIIAIVLITLILSIGIYTAISSHNWQNIIKDMKTNENSVVKDNQNNTIATFGSQKIKEKIENDQIPENLKHAYVAIEDERFYSHHGVDIKRTGSAILSYIFHRGSSAFGGSTITQQLVKNLTGENESKITRKVKEWGRAWSLENCMSKDEILELYLNVIYVGPNLYGVETGSKYYFNKSTKDLSLEECAFLAGINNSPNSYNPFDNGNLEKIKTRTKTVLSKMLELKYINQEEYKNAVQNVENGLKFKNGKVEANEKVNSYHTDALESQLINDLCKKKSMSKTFATNYIEMAGLTITSTENINVQKEMEKEFEKSKYQLKSKNGGSPSQAAMVIIDHKTGYVVGCVGGLGKKTTVRGLNRATQSIRQTGSAIKPIAVLAPGIDKKIFTGATVFEDSKKTFADNYSPENYSKYLGNITVRRALESSQNIPFVEMMEKIKPQISMKYLEKMGITTLSKEDENLALALGGLDKGISPLEMAGAYATIANDGTYIEPTFYSKVVDSKGVLVLEVKQKKTQVFSKEVAYILKELLTEPVKGNYGTATYCAISGIDVAAKTGTTDENYDRWLCGFTPYYTGVSWFGYDQNETILYNGKKNPAGILWANIMARVHSTLKNATFEKPTSVMTAIVCSKTGKIANSGCPNTYKEYFLWGTMPEKCNEHSGNELKENEATKTDTNKNEIVDSFDMTTKDDVDQNISRPSEESNVVKDNVNNATNSNNVINNTNEDVSQNMINNSNKNDNNNANSNSNAIYNENKNNNIIQNNNITQNNTTTKNENNLTATNNVITNTNDKIEGKKDVNQVE